MRKQKHAGKICYCQQYRFDQKQIKSMLIEKLQGARQSQQWSNQKLLRVYFQYVSQKDKYAQAIDQMLRSFIKQEPTIHYTPNDNAVEMINAILAKIKKQREVHQSVLKKERHSLQQHIIREKKLEGWISNLNEVVKQKEKQILNFRRIIEQSHLKIQQLQSTVQKQKESIQQYQDKVTTMESANSQLAQQILQKSEEMARLNQQLQAEIDRIRQQVKLSTQKQLAFKNQLEKSKHSKQERQEYSQERQDASGLSSKQCWKIKFLTHSMTSDKQSRKVMNLDSTLSLSRSTSRHYASSNIWIEKSRQLDGNASFSDLFVGDILFNQKEMRGYLVQLLQKVNKNLIVKTKVLYRLDSLSKVNIHRYIDGHNNIVFLFKTDNDQTIAAYSRGAFRPRSASNNLGLIVSLNNKIAFKNIKKAIVYDQNEIIFGNFDLRYRSGDNKIISNFGMNGSFYESKGHSLGVLLGEAKNRQVKIRNLEVFSVAFQS